MTVNTSRGRLQAAADPGPAHRTWAPLAVMLTGTFMIVLDFFIVNVAIPSIQRDLHTGPAGIEWVVTAYGLTYGVGLITGGRLGDRYGLAPDVPDRPGGVHPRLTGLRAGG